MSRTGIMGGTFDPVHLAHIEMARCAKAQYNLERILFMPSKIPPHKQGRKILPEKLRGEMIQLAIEEETDFYYSDFELKREEVTYTAKTLELLKKQHPEESLYFIMGGDSLFQLENWYLPEKILKYAVVLAGSRNGLSSADMQVKAEELSERFSGRIEVFSMPEMNVSSSMIREKLFRGEPVEKYLPPKVYAYITEKGLYRADA